MKRIGIIGICCLLFFSCGEEEVEPIELSDIIQTSDKYSENGETSTDQQETVDTLSIVKQRFTKNGIPCDSVVAFEETLFPDRFGAISTEKYELFTSENQFRYVQWKYEDSAKVMNAFFNWMDCYGKSCKSIFIGEERLFQANPFQLFVNDSVLIYIEGVESFDFKKWEDYLDKSGYPKDWNFVIEQRKLGKARWFQYIEEKKTPYKKNEDSK